MRRLVLVALALLAGCATVPQQKMSLAEAGLAPDTVDTRAMLAMAYGDLPAELPHYVLSSSIVNPGTGGIATGGTCPFKVNTTSNSYAVACDGTISIGTLTYGVGGVNLQGAGSVTNAVNVTAGNSIQAGTNMTTPSIANIGANGTLSVVGDKNAADTGNDVSIGSSVTRTNGHIVSIQNNTVEKSYFDFNGTFVAGNASIGTGGLNLANALGITNATTISVAAGLTASNVNTLSIAGNKADGASAVGVSLNNATTLANAGAKLLSVQNNGTERHYFDVNGAPFWGTTLKPGAAVISASAAQAICATTATLTTGAATVTFSSGGCGAAFAATPVCVCTDQTANASVKCSETSTTLTIAGTGSDVIAFNCVGNR